MLRKIGAGVPGVLGIGSAIAATLLATLAILPSQTAFAAAVFPPWWDNARAFRAAASVTEVVSVSRTPFIIIVRNDSEVSATQLREAGALLVLGSRAFVACSAPTVEQFR